MIVMKFGGTSTQDAQAMKNVAEIVKSRIVRRPIVVISAIAQATNQLERMGCLAAEGQESAARDLMLKLFSRHYEIVDSLISDSQRQRALRQTMASYLTELETLIRGVSILRELTPRTLDHFYSFGELLSSLIVSYVFIENGINAVWVDTKEFMETDDCFTKARPYMEKVEVRLTALSRPLLDEKKTIVTQGFLGATSKGDRTTMGRESSDYSAAVIGAVLGVDEIQIWTDVDGVLTADPRIVVNPRKVKVLSFEEAYELSYFGAKVLHPNTILPAIERGIPIHVFNSRHPNALGTQIGKPKIGAASVAKSITFKPTVTLVTVLPRQRINPLIFWEHVFNILTKHGLSPRMISSSEYKIVLAIDGVDNYQSILHELNEIGFPEIQEGMAIVSVVGQNIRENAGFVSRVFRVLDSAKIAMVSYGASASNLSFVVAEEAAPDVVRQLHAEFFDSISDDVYFELLPDSSA